MTINSTNNEIEYTGNEETTTFVFPYKFFSATDLKVKLDGVLQSGGYGVTGMCDNNGGEVMFDVAPGIGVVINIKREVPATSEFHPTDYNKFPAESVENAIDRAVVLAGQNVGVPPDLSNSLKIPDEAGLTFNTVLPAKSLRVNKYVMFDSDGNVTVGAGGGGSGSGDVSSSISSTTDGKVAVFDGTTGKIIKDTTITGMLKASSGVLAQAISDTDFVSVSAFNTLDGRVGTAETDIGTLESSLTSKASIDLDNISSAGVAVIQSYATGGGANVSLSNLDATGEARFTNKASIDLDNLSPAGEAKIAGGGANVSLSNLDATGEARFTEKANINSPVFTGVPESVTPSTSDSSTKVATTAHVIANKNLCADVSLGNIDASAQTVVQNLAKKVCAPYPSNGLNFVGAVQCLFTSVGGALVLPAGGTYQVFAILQRDESTLNAALSSITSNDSIFAGGTTLLGGLAGVRGIAHIMKIA